MNVDEAELEAVRRVRGPQGIQKTWQAVLEEFARSVEPQTWELETVRIDPVDKFEAVMYLVSKGLLRQCGRVREEHCDFLYEATPEGRFMWEHGLTEVNRRKRPNGVREQKVETTLAQRTVLVAHRSVFDLARLPWTYNLRAEELKEFGDEATR